MFDKVQSIRSNRILSELWSDFGTNTARITHFPDANMKSEKRLFMEKASLAYTIKNRNYLKFEKYEKIASSNKS